jgi:hypothetical protein
LLARQDELRGLEERLDLLDEKQAEEKPRLLQSREDDDIKSGERKKLLLEIEEKFKNYGYSDSLVPESLT